MSASFSLDVEQWVAKAKGLANAAFQATAMDAVNTVKAFTPVVTGFLRANWTAVKNNDPPPLPARVQSPEKVIASLVLGDRLLILNPVVYAARVEYGFTGTDSAGRHFDQKGAGMMQRTMDLLPEIAQKATARVMAGGDPLVSPVDPGDEHA
jgi:hypothetical protein